MPSIFANSDPRNTIWWLTASPLVWTAHFLGSYLTAAIWCAKQAPDGGSAEVVQWTVGVYTVIALVLILIVGILSYRRHRLNDDPTPHDFASESDQQRFLGFSAFLLSLLSAIAVIFTALVFVFVGSCH